MKKRRRTRTVMGALGDLLKEMFGTDSNDAMAHYNLGLAYHEKGKIDEAIGAF